MSGSLPRSQRRVAPQGARGIVQMPNAAGDSSSIARAMAGLAETLSGTSTQMRAEQRRLDERRDIFAADEEARTAPIRDAEGNYVVEQRDPLTPVGRTYNAGIAKRYADDQANRMAEAAVGIRAQAQNDPAKFQELWRGYAEGVVGSSPAWLRNETTALADRLGAEHARGVASETQQTERRLQAQSWGARREALERDLLGLAAGGKTSGPEWDTAQARYGAHLNDGVTTRQVAPDAANVMRESVQEQTIGAATVRATQDLVRGGGTREDVLRQFDAQMDRQNVPSGQRERLRNLVEGTLAEQEALKREGRTEVTAQAEDWQTRITGGVAVPADEGLRLAAEADRLGAPRLAQKIRDMNAVQQDARVYATLPTAELARQAQTNAAKLLQDGASARDVQLSELTSRMLTQRRAAMDADPLTAGAQVYRSTTGPLVPLDFGNLDTVGAQLQQRERQAGQISRREGRPVSALTKPEAEGLKTLLENGTTDQQQAVLRGLTSGLSPSVMAATLDTLTKGDSTAPRVQAFTVAAARSISNPRMSTDILRGMQVMRELNPRALQGDAWRTTLATKMGPVLPGRPDTMAQVGEAARAIYAQRFATGANPEKLMDALDTEKFGAILDEIMPTVRMGGNWFGGGAVRVPVPRPGMTQTQFDEEMARMPASALAGARATDGRALTPEMVRRDGRLVPVGEGVFEVRVNGMEVLGENGRNFRLDMRQPWQPDPVTTGDAGFRRALANSEGGRADLAAQNREGYVGRYQMGTARMAELGVYEPAPGENVSSNGWGGTIRVPGMAPMTLAEFKRNEAAQERVADMHFAEIDKVIDDEGLIGRTVRGERVTRNGLRAVAHLGGTNGMRRFVNSDGEYDPADSNGTRLSAYQRKFSRAA